MSQAHMTSFDILILGGGSGGYSAALRAAELGFTVGLVEQGKVGGTCLHQGCIPTKALLHSAETADNVRESARFGIQSILKAIDMPTVNAYKNNVIAKLYKGLRGLISSRKVAVIDGHGILSGKNALTVDGVEYTAKHVILASGSASRTLPGLQVGGRIITSEQALRLDYIPQSVIVLGGGVIGVEFASIWKSFGAEVTIVEALPRLVANEDPAISKALERAYRKRGISFSTGVRFQQAEQDGSTVHVTLEDGKSIHAELLLVAVGRGPVTADLGYEEQGISVDRGFVVTNERLHTGVGNIHAVGDIVPGLQLAHRGFQQGIFVAEEIAGLNPAVIDESGIPRVTYCNPEIGSVGLTEPQAIEKYGKESIQSLEYNLAGNGKSNILGASGFVKIIREKDGPVIGMHMIGERVSEQIGEAQITVNWEAYPEEVAALIHAHPTQSEALGEAQLALAGKPLHAHN